MKTNKISSILLVSLLSVACGPTIVAEGTYIDVISYFPATANYLQSGTGDDSRLFANTQETLFEGDRFGKYVPALAETFSLVTKGSDTTFTVTLKPNLVWVTSTGEEYAKIVAQDWVTAAQYVLAPNNISETYWLYGDFVKGAYEYYDAMSCVSETDPAKKAACIEEFGTADFSKVGIKALDERTIEWKLNQAFTEDSVLSAMSYSVFLPVNKQFLDEVGTNFGTVTRPETSLYSGAFLIDGIPEENVGVRFKRNPRFWNNQNVVIEKLQLTMIPNGAVSSWVREEFERGALSSFSPSPNDAQGYETYVTGGPNGGGTVQNPVHPNAIPVDGLHNVSSGVMLFNVDRVDSPQWESLRNRRVTNAITRSGNGLIEAYAPNGLEALSGAERERAEQVNAQDAMRNKYFRLGVMLSYPRQLQTGYPAAWEQLIRNIYTYEGLVSTSKNVDYIDLVETYIIEHWDEFLAPVEDILTEEGIARPVAPAKGELHDGHDALYYPELARAFFIKAEEELVAKDVVWPVNLELAFPTAQDSPGLAYYEEMEKIINGVDNANQISPESPYSPKEGEGLGSYGIVKDFVHLITVGYLSTDYLQISNNRGSDIGVMYWGPDYADPTSFLNTFKRDGAWGAYMGIETADVRAGETYLDDTFDASDALLAEADVILTQASQENLSEDERAELFDLRLEKLAETEAKMMLQEGLIFNLDTYNLVGEVVTVTKVIPYRMARTGVGLSEYDRTYVKVQEEPLTREEYQQYRTQWLADLEAQANK